MSRKSQGAIQFIFIFCSLLDKVWVKCNSKHVWFKCNIKHDHTMGWRLCRWYNECRITSLYEWQLWIIVCIRDQNIKYSADKFHPSFSSTWIHWNIYFPKKLREKISPNPSVSDSIVHAGNKDEQFQRRFLNVFYRLNTTLNFWSTRNELILTLSTAWTCSLNIELCTQVIQSSCFQNGKRHVMPGGNLRTLIEAILL